MGKIGSRMRAYFGRNEFLRHVLALMSGTALAQVVVMALMPVLSRLYTPEQFGVLAAFTSVVAIISAVAALKYDMAIMLPERDEDAIVLKRTVTWIAFLSGVFATIACLLLARPIAELINAPDVAPWLAIAGLSAFTLAEIAALGYWLNRKSRYSEMAGNRVVQSGSTAVLQVLFGLLKPLGAGGLILGTILGQLISILALRRKTPELRRGAGPSLHARTTLLRRYRRMPLLNAPTALIDALRMNGILLVIATISLSSLGQFSMAWRMVEVPAALISGALAQVFFQRLSVTPPGQMRAAVLKSVARSALFGALPFVLVFVLSPWLFPLAFGADWDQAGHFARALVPWLFMNLITSPISTIFVVTERQHIMLAYSIIFTIVPIGTIILLSADMLLAVTVMSWAMAGMLMIFVFLAIWVARGYDQGARTTEEKL